MSRPNRFKGIAGRAFESPRSVDSGEVEAPVPAERVVTERLPGARVIPLSLLAPDPSQPRKQFPATKLEELAQSIRAHGVLQPLLVTQSPDSENYTIIAGERRYRAAKLAGLDRIPCRVVASVSDATRLEQQLIENLQREGLSPFDECAAFEVLREHCGMTHQQIAERVGKGRTYVTKTLSLRRIPVALLTELAGAGVTGREQLILVAQQKDEKAMHKLVRALGSETRTVRALRSTIAGERAAPKRGRRVTIRLASGTTVTVSLARARSSTEDLVRALEEAIAEVRARRIGF
jgi:ParB family transcriptional regulator, chromosome partitioning protein